MAILETLYRNYVKLTGLTLSQGRDYLTSNFVAIDNDIDMSLRLDVNPVFESGVVTGDVVYRTASESYQKAELENISSVKDKNLGIANIERQFVVFYGLAYIVSTFTIGDRLYLSEDTAGVITNNETRLFLGYYSETNTILLQPKFNSREYSLFGDADSIDFISAGGSPITITNYESVNLTSSILNKATGIITIPDTCYYKIQWYLLLEQTASAVSGTPNLKCRLNLPGGANKLIGFNYDFSNVDNDVFFSGYLNMLLNKDDQIKLNVITEGSLSGTLTYDVNYANFSVKRINYE